MITDRGIIVPETENITFEQFNIKYDNNNFYAKRKLLIITWQRTQQYSHYRSKHLNNPIKRIY